MRWWAIAGVTFVLILARASGVIETVGYPLAVVIGLACANLVLALSLARGQLASRRRLEISTLVYIQLDLLALTLLLHFTGGIENPCASFYVFHIAIASILLRSYRPPLIAVAAVVMYGCLVLGEQFDLLHHYRLGAPFLDSRASMSTFTVLGRLGALAVSLGAVIYLVQTVVSQQRRSETLQRSHARLAQSRERLARVGEISAGLAHSVRNPLHGALNCVQILHSDPGETEAAEAFDLLDESLERMREVTDRLLVLTRDAPVRRRLTDLAEVVRGTVRFLQIRSRETGVDLRLEITDADLIPLDPDHLHEALFNVIDNAIAASSADAAPVSVIVRSSDQEPGGYLVEVRDRGAGIQPKDMDRIFDPFFTTKAIGAGSGLGLAIARRIIDAHGGSIAVESEFGVGTEVRIFLPSEIADELDSS